MIAELEEQLEKAETDIREKIKIGNIPTTADYSDLDRIKKALKTARRVQTMQAGRTEPVRDVVITIRVDREERRRLSDNAAAAAKTLPEYVRFLLKEHV